MTETATKPVKLGAEKLTPEEQKRSFIGAAQAAGASEDEAEFDAPLKTLREVPAMVRYRTITFALYAV